MRTPYSAEGVEWCARGVLRAAACIAVVAVGAWKLNAQTMTVRGFMDFYDTGTAARTMASVGTIRCSYYQPVAVGGSASDGWTFTPAGEALVGDAAANMMPLIAWEVSDGATVYNTMIASVVEWRGDFDIRGYDTSLRIGLVPGDASTEAGRVYVGSRTRTDSGTAMGWRTFPESSCRFGIQYGCLSGSEHTGRAGPIFPFVVATKPDACGSGYSPCSPLDTWVAAGIVASPVTDDSDNARNLGAAQWTGIHSATDPGTTLWQTMYWGSPICIGIRFENSGTNEITVYSSTGFRARGGATPGVRLNSDGVDFPWLKFTINPGESPWSVIASMDDTGIIAAIEAHEASAHTDAAAILQALTTTTGSTPEYALPEEDASQYFTKAEEAIGNFGTRTNWSGPAMPEIPTDRHNPVYTLQFDVGSWGLEAPGVAGIWELTIDFTWYEPMRVWMRYLLLVPVWIAGFHMIMKEWKRQ